MARCRLVFMLIILLSLVSLASINIELGEIIFLPQKGVTRVVIGNSEVISAVPVADGVVITAKDTGTSEVMIFQGSSQKKETILVRLPKNEKEKALTILENLGLKVQEKEGSFIIKGKVLDEKTLNYAEGLAAILDNEVVLDIVVDKYLAEDELNNFLAQMGIKLSLISQTAVLTGQVPSKEFQAGILSLVSYLYPETVSLLEIKDTVLKELPPLGYKGVKIKDYGEVAILEGSVDSEKEAQALTAIVAAFREKVINLVTIKPPKEQLPQSLFTDLGQLKLERLGEEIMLIGEVESLALYNLAIELFESLYPKGKSKVTITGGKKVLEEWAEILNCELIQAEQIYAVRGDGKNLEVLIDIGKLYNLYVFPISKDENALEFLRALLDLKQVELNLFKDTLYVKGLPEGKKTDFALSKVIYLDGQTNPKEPYTVMVSGFQVTEKDLDQISLDTAKLISGWQEVVLNWQDLGIIKDLAREWEIKQPSVLVYPGEKTSLHTGGEIPIPYSQGVEWREFGVNLDCQFGLIEDGLIPGYLNIVVSDLDWGNGIHINGSALPALKRYAYEGQVQLPKGGGVLLLRHWSQKEGWLDKSVPYLRGLPIFGTLIFGKRQRQTQSQIMCVLVEVK